MRRMSLDPGKKCGWAVSDGPRIIGSGVQEFNHEDVHVRFDVLNRWLSTNLLKNNIQELYCEQYVPVAQTSLNAIEWLLAFKLAAARAAAHLHIPHEYIHTSQWRQTFIGTSKAPKEIDPKKRSKWLKDAVKEKCAVMGLEVKDDNQGDAIGILKHVLCLKYPETAHENTPLFEGAA